MKSLKDIVSNRDVSSYTHTEGRGRQGHRKIVQLGQLNSIACTLIPLFSFLEYLVKVNKELVKDNNSRLVSPFSVPSLPPFLPPSFPSPVALIHSLPLPIYSMMIVYVKLNPVHVMLYLLLSIMK